MTSDGIHKKDWDLIAELSAQIANALCADNHADISSYTQEMFDLISSLEKKYGYKSSLLATRAEYTEDKIRRLDLLLQAFEIAEKSNDIQNKTLISSSIAELYMEEFEDQINGEYWISVLERCLIDYFDKGEASLLNELKKKLLSK